MAQVLVRNIPDDALDLHRARARANGRSLEAELRELIAGPKRLSPEERVALVREMQKEARAYAVPGAVQTPAWILIREDRDQLDR